MGLKGGKKEEIGSGTGEAGEVEGRKELKLTQFVSVTQLSNIIS